MMMRGVKRKVMMMRVKRTVILRLIVIVISACRHGNA